MVPPSSPNVAFNQSKIKIFCRKYGLSCYECQGICHTIMLEKGFVQPDSVIAGGYPHTPIYGVAGAVGLGLCSTDIAAALRTVQTWLEIPETIRVEVSGLTRKGVINI
ncbi:MAG: aconitase family protein [Candidatus Bathycorpusculaceae bacterium]